jgi:hypothetical protein
MNMMIDSAPMATRVEAALRLSGGRKAGTPFETASTPVIAVQPFEKAVKSANVDKRLRGLPGCSNSAGDAMAPVKYRQVPTPNIPRMPTMKKYVGTANIRPDSLTPRRLPIVSTTTNPIAISTR